MWDSQMKSWPKVWWIVKLHLSEPRYSCPSDRHVVMLCTYLSSQVQAHSLTNYFKDYLRQLNAEAVPNLPWIIYWEFCRITWTAALIKVSTKMIKGLPSRWVTSANHKSTLGWMLSCNLKRQLKKKKSQSNLTLQPRKTQLSCLFKGVFKFRSLFNKFFYFC